MSEAATAVRELLELLADALDLDARVEMRESEGEVVGTLVGEDLGLFIGRHGQTIDAVQHLAQRVAFKGGPAAARIVVDGDGYRARRAATLRRQAEDAAEEAARSGRPVALDAMTASERRLVHEHLRELGGVTTASEGEEPDRRLVVSVGAPVA